jgi:cell wall-associated NlpC family hydrolase
MEGKHIVNAARAWVGTPFHHQGRVKGIGCDCLGLIMGVAHELEIPSRQGGKLTDYDSSDYHFIHDSRLLLAGLNQHLALKGSDPEEIEAGDILLIRFDSIMMHLGIATYHETTQALAIIHSLLQARKVVEQIVPEEYFAKVVGVYRFW